LPAIDLAISRRARPAACPALRAFKAGSPRFSYRLVRQALLTFLMLQSDLLGTIPPTESQDFARVLKLRAHRMMK